jgi:hypothetical protein
MTEAIEAFLHCVTDKDEGADPVCLRLTDRVVEGAPDLGVSADAGNRTHQLVQLARCRHPPTGLALVVAAVEDELDFKPADRGGRLEHLALDPTGTVPGRLARSRGVERKDQPAGRAWRRFEPFQKGVYLDAAAGSESRVFGHQSS